MLKFLKFQNAITAKIKMAIFLNQRLKFLIKIRNHMSKKCNQSNQFIELFMMNNFILGFAISALYEITKNGFSYLKPLLLDEKNN